MRLIARLGWAPAIALALIFVGCQAEPERSSGESDASSASDAATATPGPASAGPQWPEGVDPARAESPERRWIRNDADGRTRVVYGTPESDDAAIALECFRPGDMLVEVLTDATAPLTDHEIRLRAGDTVSGAIGPTQERREMDDATPLTFRLADPEILSALRDGQDLAIVWRRARSDDAWGGVIVPGDRTVLGALLAECG